MFRTPGPPILTVLPYPSVSPLPGFCSIPDAPKTAPKVWDPDTGQGRPARNVAAANGRPDAIPRPKSSVTMGGTSGAQTASRRSAPVRPRKCFTIAANGERVWRSGPRRLLASQDEEADLLMPAPPPSDGHTIPWAPISAIAASQSRDVARRVENRHVGEVSQASLSARGNLGKEARLRNRPGARHKGVSLGC
jgi:hypothetical protein